MVVYITIVQIHIVFSSRRIVYDILTLQAQSTAIDNPRVGLA